MNINPISVKSFDVIKQANTPSFKGRNNTDASCLTLTGSETQAKVYTQNVDYQTINQIKTFCNHPVFRDTPIRIMPDTHAGKNSVVGFSAPIGAMGEVIPNIIGGDIGCGMLCVKLDTKGSDIDFQKLDDVIKTYISTKRTKTPIGVDKLPLSFLKQINDMCKYKYKKSPEKITASLGTLGGGNHFIEIDKDQDGVYYLVIHTGSRHFGKETAGFHQQIAEQQNPYRIKDLSFLSGAEAKDYLDDVQLAAKYSQVNRRIIADEILARMGWKEQSSFESIHNYIADDNIIRKGAIRADEGQQILIPLNMRDGAVIAIGKGNNDWNNTAPHGAGRQYKRSEAASHITLDEYRDSMKGIYTSCISQASIDESPQAYKDSMEIIENIEATADVQDIISPVFNYKD